MISIDETQLGCMYIQNVCIVFKCISAFGIKKDRFNKIFWAPKNLKLFLKYLLFQNYKRDEIIF